MPSDPETCLRDILGSVEEIEAFLSGLSLQQYQADRRTRLAVERLLQIATEAAFRLGTQAADLCPEVDWSGVRGFGNFLRHEYDKVSDATIWKILHESLPMLRDAVRRALDRITVRQDLR